MLKILKENAGFYVPFLLFLAFGAVVILMYEIGNIHLFINQFHHPVCDQVMPYLTWLGDGWFIAFICFLSLFYEYRLSLLLILANLISSGITYFLKFQIYTEANRPAEYFQGKASLHLVEGLDIHSHFSFPSGHATIVFATCAVLAVLPASHFLKGVLFLVALFAAYTRVYLSQHFFNDIFAGAGIGTITSLILLTLFQKYQGEMKTKWIKKSLLRR